MTDTADQEGGTKFEPLATALGPYFGKPIDQYPEALRRRVRQLVIAPVWNALSEDQQRSAAAQSDMQHDPALEDERLRTWGLVAKIHDLTAQLNEMKASNPEQRPSEIELKRLRVAELEAEISQLESELSRGAEATPATPGRAPTESEADGLVVQYQEKHGKVPNKNAAEAFAKAEGFIKTRDEMRAAVDRATGSRGRGRPPT